MVPSFALPISLLVPFLHPASTAPTPPLQPRSTFPPPYNQGQCSLEITIQRIDGNYPMAYNVNALSLYDNSHRPIGAVSPTGQNAIHHISIPSVLEQPLQLRTGDTSFFQVGDDTWTTHQGNSNTGAHCDWPGWPEVGNDASVDFTCYFPCFYGGGAPSDADVWWDAEGAKWVYPEFYGPSEKKGVA
ncbi:hypothetical protein MMC21_000557 [Puttea exsequens]|nr:hypothetical protein [Puttea exsequens]